VKTPENLFEPARHARLVNVRRLIMAYYAKTLDSSKAAQRVSFGASGHHGSPLNGRFNEAHVLSICQAICDYRKRQAVDDPLFVGIHTHALSMPTFATAIEVLAANDIEVVFVASDTSTPALAVSQAVRAHNQLRAGGLADGILITQARNRPNEGGFEYRLPQGDPATTEARCWIETAANEYLRWGPASVRRLEYREALASVDGLPAQIRVLVPNRSLCAASP
jgi:phosphoglucomutase